MAKTLSGINCFDAWQNVAKHLISKPNHEDTNLLTTITNPTDFSDLSDWIKNYNPKDIDYDADNIRQVINTIFPYRLQSYFQDRNEFFDKYGEVFNRSKNKKWGTYFQRLISYGKQYSPDNPNQIENAINSLQGNSPQRFFITFHLTSSNIESNVRPMGGPCWQYGELTVNSDHTVNLVAVYRNHDYFNKAFGNFIGLSKLLEFICSESNRSPGTLIVHSIHAYSDMGITKFKELVE